MPISLSRFVCIAGAASILLVGVARASEDPGIEGNAYYGCLFVESQRGNQPMSTDGIARAQEACKDLALEYGEMVAKRAGSPGGQALRHNSRKFIQGYLKQEVPAGLRAAGLLK